MSRWDAILFFAALVFPFAFILVLGHKRRKFGAVLFAVYVLSYLPFAHAGKYVIANHGGSDWRREWAPRFLVVAYRGLAGREKTRLTLGGAVFWPCILLDQVIWHRTSANHIFESPKACAEAWKSMRPTWAESVRASAGAGGGQELGGYPSRGGRGANRPGNCFSAWYRRPGKLPPRLTGV